jgi:hypothetical protein
MAKDDADRASEEEEYNRLEALHKVTQVNRYQLRGLCYFCDEHVDSDLLFCDVFCREDYERRQGTMRRQYG